MSVIVLAAGISLLGILVMVGIGMLADLDN